MPGVTDARLNFTNRRLTVDWRDGELQAGEVIGALARIGYRAHPFEAERAESDEADHARWLMHCLAVAGFAAMNIMLLSVSVWSGSTDMTPETRDFFHWLSALIALPAAAYAGQPFFQSACARCAAASSTWTCRSRSACCWRSACRWSRPPTTPSTPISIPPSCCCSSCCAAASSITRCAARRARSPAISRRCKAEVAHRFERGGEVVMVPVAALKPGDRLLVRPGERVPADGVVIAGASEIDESLITGETVRRKVAPNAQVYAGSLNYSGALTMRVTAAGAGSLIDEVERLLDKAAAAKSRYLRLADRAARLYAPMVHATAALTAVGWLIAGASWHDAIVTAIAVLIITCPCALALAIPAVQVVASGALFRAGVILNTGDAIERLAEVDTVVFDKTGTLTLPEPRVANADAIDADLLERAARLALSSRHPLARRGRARGARPDAV